MDQNNENVKLPGENAPNTDPPRSGRPTTASNGEGVSFPPSAGSRTQNGPIASNSSSSDLGNHPTPKRKRRYLRSGLAALLILLIVGGWLGRYEIMRKYFIRSQVRSWVAEATKNAYDVEIGNIHWSQSHDTLSLIGVKVTPALGKDGKPDTSSAAKLAIRALPIERMDVDTMRIVGADLWTLMMKKGLFTNSVSLISPQIYVSAAQIPKLLSSLDSGESPLPGFMPIISIGDVKVTNAKLIMRDAAGEKSEDADEANGVSLHLKDFYLDRSNFKSGRGKVFSGGGNFSARDIEHHTNSGDGSFAVHSMEGSLSESTIALGGISFQPPTIEGSLINSVENLKIDSILVSGINWQKLLSKQGLTSELVTVVHPRITATLHNKTVVARPKDNFLAELVPSLSIDRIVVRDAELSNFMPGATARNGKKGGAKSSAMTANTIRHISLELKHFFFDSASAEPGLASFYSKEGSFVVPGATRLESDAIGSVVLHSINGNVAKGQITVATIDLDPSIVALQKLNTGAMIVTGVDWMKLLTRQGLYAAKILVHAPRIVLQDKAIEKLSTTQAQTVNKVEAKSNHIKQPVLALPDLLPSINIKNIAIVDGEIVNVQLPDLDAAIYAKTPEAIASRVTGETVKHITLNLQNFKLDKSTLLTQRGALFSKSAKFSAGSLTHFTENGFYEFSEKGIHGDLAESSIIIDSIGFRPLLTEDSFASRHVFRTDRIDISASQVHIMGLDIARLLDGGGIATRQIDVKDLFIDLYGDKWLPQDPKHYVQLYPHDIFQKLEPLVMIDSIKLSNGRIQFRERYAMANEPAYINLTGLNATIGPITNDKRQYLAPTPTMIDGEMSVMGKGLLTFRLEYPLMSPSFSMKVDGKFKGMTASELNPYLEHAEFDNERVSISAGAIQPSEFSINYLGNNANGYIQPLYDSLDLKVLPPKQWEKSGLFEMVASFFANAFIIRTHNSTDKDHPPQKAAINATRDEFEPFFQFIWVPVRDGLRSIIGF
jgi:hypothetical protein